jgi:hypothetical protein
MDSEEEELEPKVKYSFIVYEEDYEEEDPDESRSDSADDQGEVQPWDPTDIFFRIK